MVPAAARASVGCSRFGQGSRVQYLAPVVAWSIAAGRPSGMLADARGDSRAGRRPVTTPHGLTCAHCGDVIGVYEPLLITGGGEVRVTSLAAERDVGLERTAFYHRACYAAPERDAAADR